MESGASNAGTERRTGSNALRVNAPVIQKSPELIMAKAKDDVRSVETDRAEPPGPAPPLRLPAVIPAMRPRHGWRFLRSLFLFPIAFGIAEGIAYQSWRQAQNALPPGIFSGNGRLEADEIDIGTKFAGRIAKLFVDQGDMVKAGQVVTVMDTRDLQAQLKQYQSPGSAVPGMRSR